MVFKSLTSINNTSEGEAEPEDTYPADLKEVVDAGLLPIWKKWIKFGKLNFISQKAQIVSWAYWIREGMASVLRLQADEVMEAGSYAHPFAGLKSRMSRVLKAEINPSPSSEGRSAGAVCQPGELRRAPDGQVWTVEVVEHGMVFFAEPHGPLDVADRSAATWPVVGHDGVGS